MAEPSNSGGIQAPEKFKYKVKAGPSLMLEGFGGEGVTYPTTTVTLTIEDKSYQMNVAVAARSTLKGKSALLGRDIPFSLAVYQPHCLF